MPKKLSTRAIKNKKLGKMLLLILAGLLTMLAVAVCVAVFRMHAVWKVDEKNLPKFVQANFIDLKNVGAISRFRSGAGHDFSDSTSKCSSMKHYFNPLPANALNITSERDVPPGAPNSKTGFAVFSPVTGAIARVQAEHFPLGKQIYITPDTDPTFTIRLFHVYLAPGVHAGQRVHAGERIGYIWKGQGMDVAVQAAAFKGRKLFSFFEVMPDRLFAQYQKAGIDTRDQIIISAAERAANPLSCQGEVFTSSGDSDPAGLEKNYIQLNQ